MLTVQEWSSLPTSLLERGQLRTLKLFLQAAQREGLLPPAEVCGEELHWSRGGQTLCVLGSLDALGSRLQLGSMPWLLGARDRSRLDLAGAIRLVRELSQDQADDAAWEALLDELEEAARVQAAAYLACQRRGRPSSAAEFEVWTPEGHNLHPGAKTRQGFSPEEMLAYAPDFSPTVELPWIAVAKSLLAQAGEMPPAFHLDGETWCLPVHPWQLKHVLPAVYAEEWGQGLLRLLDRPPLRARLSTSLRTVDPVDRALPLLKLSVGSLMTSTERSMSPHTARQGPIYSAILRHAKAEQPRWGAVDFMRESGGLYWAREGEQGPRSRQLTMVLRERLPDPSRGLAIPCSSLPQPLSEGGTLLAELFSRGPGPLASFRRYCELLIPVHLELFQAWGVALEAHLQNCLVVWSESGPERLWLRDWGGLRVDLPRLKQRLPELAAQLDPASITVSNAASAARKLIACLYPNHLTEIVVGMFRELGVPESESWAVVREVSLQCLAAPGDQALAEQILERSWPVKALLRMRLGGGGDIYASLPNPLAALPAAGARCSSPGS